MMAHVVVRGSPRGTAAPSQVVINTWWFTNATQNGESLLCIYIYIYMNCVARNLSNFDIFLMFSNSIINYLR